MKDKDRSIRDQMSDFRIGDYDPDAGWAQLEQRLHPHRKRIGYWRYAVAACLMALSVGAFLYRSHAPETAEEALHTMLGLNLPTDSLVVNARAVMNPGMQKKKAVSALSQKMTSVAKRSHSVIPPPGDIPVDAIAAINPEPTTDHLVLHPAPVNVVVQPAAPATKSQSKLPVLTEDAFGAIVNLEKPRLEKQKRFLKYLAGRGRQTDYTAEKLSSSSTIVKF
ncbi:hypothetical protein [Niabella hirudinis]|uniref:hypothetical protein n=1 Tax=Niabella hirudinis TaxID=1285929 RepID=UPI003EBE5CCD